MKDDELGLALLYNFSKGYDKPVPLELYDVVLPLLYNDTNDKKFVICYDPARSRDNSIILIMEIYFDEFIIVIFYHN